MTADPHARAAELEAERLRPVPPRPTLPAITPEDLANVLAEAFPTPHPHRTQAEARQEDYAFLRAHREGVEAAAVRVGIRSTTARQKYEPRFRKGQQ